MKKKIFIGFVILTACFVGGGIYIARSIDQVISKLEAVITLHQVEILRKSFLTDVKAVQQDLLLKDSPHEAEDDSVIRRGEKMAEEVAGCFACHHAEPALHQLKSLQGEIDLYQKALSRVYTTRANAERLSRQKQVAFHIGQHLIEEIDNIIEYSSRALGNRTQLAKHSIAETKKHLTFLVIAGPVIGLAIALYFIHYLTRSMGALIDGTRKLESGQLDHKIEGLRDEFGELGASINEMAHSLGKMIRAIEESQKRYRMLFESAGDGILMLEAEGENVGGVVSANQAAADMHGYTVAEMLALNLRDLDASEDTTAARKRIDRILGGEWINVESSHRRKDGSIFPVEISAGLLEFENQKYILAFDKDITERKQAEDALQRAEQLVVVGEMAAGLAHEIKNPLAGIKVSIEVLTSELQLEQEDKEVFERIIDEINRIETLLKNLLSYATPPRPQFALVDVNKIVETAIKTAAFTLKSPGGEAKEKDARDVRFEKRLSEHLPQIVADGAQLQQVLLNLLINAMHAIQGSGCISVATAAGTAHAVQIVVSDTGKGVGGADMEKIFLPFFTTKPKGTGLGLSICKRLIEQHGGSIEVARGPQGGLMFTISLPVEQGEGSHS
ncbi:MAG: PAS domain S-box protein [Myxococcales bacterium]|nr:PAS domain S-box protein [Myxococcales bacterium]MDH5306397.1 PAS domain S-box protein [Myxococcales bacterium]MDH5566274.1 PAS domain S-box protein [Myxococcales bacterium]